MAKRQAKQSSKLTTLMSAALALPGIALQQNAESQPVTPTVRFKYGYYADSQKSGDRMEVHAPMLNIRAPLGENYVFESTTMYESMSGASPLYWSSLSGASALGIRDGRRYADVKATRSFEQLSIALGGSVSNEDDYDSKGLLSEIRFWTEDKNTVVALAGGFDADSISSTNDPSLDEKRRTGNFLIGVTQILDPNSVMQSNLTYSTADGYLSDPYKTFDTRPQSRELLAWLTRYVRYVEATDGSIHIDYRLFRDTYDITAHTLDLAYYHPLENGWLIRPTVRYYSQSRADFYSDARRFPIDRPDTPFFTADQRLSAFGEWGLGIKVSKELSETLSVDLTAQMFQQRAGFKLGSVGSRNVEPFYGSFLIVGLTKQF